MIDRLQAQLEPIARDHRLWRLWRRLTACWAAAAAAGLGLLCLDWLLGWSSRWTLILLAGAALVAAAITAYSQRKRGIDYRALARHIESEHPQLHALLLTAVEQTPDRTTGELNYLQQRVIAEALEHQHKEPWGERIGQRLSGARLAHWLSFAVFVLVLLALRPNTPSVYGLGSWAARSRGVSVTPGDTTIERGSGLVVLARFAGRLPTEATLVVKPINENERRLPLVKNLDDPIFGASLPEVKSDLTYRIEYPSGRTRDFKVGVFDFPRLERADVKLTYPSYTGLPDKLISDTRRVTAVEGTAVDYTFLLNKSVTSAQLVAKDKSALKLTVDTNNATIYHSRFTLDQSRRYELVLVDAAGRTNKMPPEFVLAALSNQPPTLKLASPRGDQRVSPLEEISFQAEVSDDFGVTAYGIAYALAGHEPTVVKLGENAPANAKRQLKYLLPLENLSAQPEQLLSYYVWADDRGPDGQSRRTTSDMYFAEVRPFEEIFREAQSPDGGQNESSNMGGGQGNRTQKLVELQKQIISATWNLKRRENNPQPSPQYRKDVEVVQQSQQEALNQVRSRRQDMDADDPRLIQALSLAEKEMNKAAESLNDAQKQNAVTPLSPALLSEQAASQALLQLQAREYQVSRSRNQRQSGSGSSSDMAQRQLDQLDLKQSENRYETQRQASPTQTRQQREQLQVLNRLKELAQRQQDLNQRLKELQTALQEAKTEAEREDVRRRLKRLREEQQQMLADVDELRQRMERPENQSSMADARQQLERTREEVQRAAEALDRQSASQALAEGTRAQRDLQQLQDDFRKKTSNQFAEDMRRMRSDARQLSQKEEQIGKKIEELAAPKQKTLSDGIDRKQLGDELNQQKAGLTNLLTQMRQVSEQSETAEPLLSQQLYDMVRQTRQDDLNKAFDLSRELVQRGFAPQAGQFEQRARQGVDELKRGVERAAESVLGDEAEALRMAKRELEDLSRQLDREMAQATATNSLRTNVARGGAGSASARGQSSNQLASASSPAEASAQNQQNQSGQSGQQGQQGQGQQGQGQQGQGQQGQGQQGQGQQGQGQQGPGQQAQAGQRGGRGQQQARAGQGAGQQDRQPGERDQQASAADGQSQSGTPSSQPAEGGSGQRNAQAGQGQGQGRGRGQNMANAQNQGGQRNGARAGGRGGDRGNFWDRAGGFGGDPAGAQDGDWRPPLTGEGFVDWSDRLRDVEEMLDSPELRSEVARVRDRARAVRQEYRRLAKQPDWNQVRLRIANPLAEVRSRVNDALARLESNEALVPIDRDPVPAKFSELVRRYYERLGKSD